MPCASKIRERKEEENVKAQRGRRGEGGRKWGKKDNEKEKERRHLLEVVGGVG